MLGIRPATPTVAPDAVKGDLIKDGSDAGFLADVVEASREVPVIVDFWATWCGPCRQLTPALEKAVTAAKGKVKLVKIDIDKHPQFAGQLRVQSIPTVYAFKDGQPVDGFMGALPESQVKAFVDKLGGGDAGPSEVDQLLALAAESLGLGDVGGAAQAYAEILQVEPDHVKAIAGLARAYLSGGDVERAAEVLEMAPPDAKDPDLASVRAALELAQTPVADDLSPLQAKVQASPDDHAARFEYATALSASGRMEEAVEELLHIVQTDREWNEDGARKQLLKIFEAAGPTSEVAKSGRRRLSGLLFS